MSSSVGDKSKKEDTSVEASRKIEKRREENSSKKWFQGASNPKTWNPSDTGSRNRSQVRNFEFSIIVTVL